MITLKKYMHIFAGLLIVATFCINIDAKNTITKKSIQKAKQVQQVRRAMNTQQITVRNRTVSANTQGQRRAVFMQRGRVKRSFGNKISQAPKQLSNARSSIKNNNLQATRKQNEQLIHNDNKPFNNDATKHLLGNTSVLPLQEKVMVNTEEKNNETEKSAVQDNQDNQDDNVAIEHKDAADVLTALSALPVDKLDQELDNLHFNEAQKEAIKKALAQLPAAVKNVNNELQDPNSIAGQSMQGKGWLEYFRSDILNYSWVKMGASWVRTAWDYTGGALLEKCGLASKETIKEYTDECFESVFQVVESFLESFGLNTPGGALDSVLMSALHGYFPKENTWSNAFAQTAFAIGYYGAVRGLSNQTIVWKTMEAFLCTSYCKYFVKDDAGLLRYPLLQKPIDFFYHYIPGFLKNGWIEWCISNNSAVKFYKYVTSLVGIGRMLAHAAMNNMQQQPKVIE